MIKTWQESYTRGDLPNLEGRIDLMQTEIDELRAALKERDAEIEKLRMGPTPPWVKPALDWAASLIVKEYPCGHNGADSWLMNYAKAGWRIRELDHRNWEESDGRWVPVKQEDSKLAAQRAVMAQALKALQTLVLQNQCDMLLTGEELRKGESAITALEGALK